MTEKDFADKFNNSALDLSDLADLIEEEIDLNIGDLRFFAHQYLNAKADFVEKLIDLGIEWK